MKTLCSEQTISFPEDVKVEIKSRKIRVTGPRGTLTRDFGHVRAEMVTGAKGRNMTVRMWLGRRADLASIRTVCSHVKNMVTGVTRGYRFKMKFVYAHFPINAHIPDDGSSIDIHNFLGEKIIRHVEMRPGCVIKRSAAVKDQLEIEGNDLENVSLSCALIHQSTLVKNKDIRKFLDGIYVSERGTIEEE